MTYEATLEAFRRGDNDEAGRLARLDLDEATAASDDGGRVDALCMLARVALREGRFEEVEHHAEQAQQVAYDSDRARLARMPIHMRAVAARMTRRHAEARALYQESIALNEELGEARMAAVEHRNLAYVEIHTGNVDEARALIAEARRRLATVDAPELTPYLTLDEATVAALDGDLANAAAKLAEADRQFQEQGAVPDPDDAFEILELRKRLGATVKDR